MSASATVDAAALAGLISCLLLTRMFELFACPASALFGPRLQVGEPMSVIVTPGNRTLVP